MTLNFDFKIPPGDPCPCKSGLAFARCCDLNDGFERSLKRSTPVPPETGFRHPRCYAAGLGGCAPKISAEHAISEGALEVWGDGRTIELKGMKWMKGDDLHKVPISTLAWDILCEDHNRSLSALDALGKKWVAHRRRVTEDMEAVAAHRPPTLFLVSGHDLERWLLKMLCGLVLSRTIDVPGIDDTDGWRPPMEWLEMMYGLRPVPVGFGLNFVGQPGEELRDSMALAVISNAVAQVYGLAATFYGLRFVLAMSTIRDGLLLGSTYRPEVIHWNNGVIDDYTLLRWSPGTTPGAYIPIHAPHPGRT